MFFAVNEVQALWRVLPISIMYWEGGAHVVLGDIIDIHLVGVAFYRSVKRVQGVLVKKNYGHQQAFE